MHSCRFQWEVMKSWQHFLHNRGSWGKKQPLDKWPQTALNLIVVSISPEILIGFENMLKICFPWLFSSHNLWRSSNSWKQAPFMDGLWTVKGLYNVNSCSVGRYNLLTLTMLEKLCVKLSVFSLVSKAKKLHCFTGRLGREIPPDFPSAWGWTDNDVTFINP